MRDKSKCLKDLATLGAKYEEKLNSLIKEKLNDNSLINISNVTIQQHVKTLKSLRQFNEIMAQQLNIPTKDDIASVARLSMQQEEKLDQIEDLLYKLLEEVKSERVPELSFPNRERTKVAPERKNEQQLSESAVIEGLSLAETVDEKTNEPRKDNLLTLLASKCYQEFTNRLEDAIRLRGKNRG